MTENAVQRICMHSNDRECCSTNIYAFKWL